MRSILITFALILMASACLSADTPTPTMTATDTPTETPTPFLLEDPYLEFYLKYSDFEPGIRYLIPQQFEVTPLPTKTPTVGEGTPTNTPHPPTATRTATPTPTPTLTPMDPTSCEYYAGYLCDPDEKGALEVNLDHAIDGQILMISGSGTILENTDFPTYPPANTPTITPTPTQTGTPTQTPTINCIYMPDTTTDATGILFKNGDRFLHNYSAGVTTTGTPIVGNNIFLGENAGNFTTGSTATANYHSSTNSAFGSTALSNIRLGYANNAFGYGAMLNCLDGRNNCAFGQGSLYYITNSNGNTAIGTTAGNLRASGSTLTSTTNSVYIGFGARGYDNSDNNTIVLGYNAVGMGANKATYGNSDITDHYFYGQIQSPIYADRDNTSYYVDPSAATSAKLAYDMEIGAGSTSDNDTLYFDQRAAYIIWRNADSRFDVTHKFTAPSFDSGLFRAGSVSSGSTAIANTFFSADSNGDGYFSFLMSAATGEHGITWSTGTSGGSIYDAYMSYTASNDTLTISANNDGVGTSRMMLIGQDGFQLVNCDTGNGTALVIDANGEILIANTPTPTSTPTATNTPAATNTPTATPTAEWYRAHALINLTKASVTGDGYFYSNDFITSANIGVPLARAGSITEFAVNYYCSDDGTNPDVVFRVQVNGLTVIDLNPDTLVSSTYDTVSMTQARGTDTFAANDRITVYCRCRGDVAPTLQNVTATIGIDFD